jgi:hypothetical protein
MIAEIIALFAAFLVLGFAAGWMAAMWHYCPPPEVVRRCKVCRDKLEPSAYGGFMHVHDDRDDHTPVAR